jgi:hypothetical protein
VGAALIFRAALLVLFLSGSASAFELRLLTGVDTLLSTSPGLGALDDAELGITAKLEARNIAGKYDVKLYFIGREGFIGNSTQNNLYELSFTAKNLANRVDVKLGRFAVPGGFWLILDGAQLTVKYTTWLSQSVWGGLRAFTTGRQPTWMTTSDNKQVLPLVGTALTARAEKVQAQVSFNWSRDVVRQRLGELVDDGPIQWENQTVDEYFIDGYLAVQPHEKVWLTGGATAGTRYDVQFNAANPYGPTTLGVATIGAVGAWGMLEARPHKRLRISYDIDYERMRLFQSELLTLKPDGTPVQAADGTFLDQQLRLVWIAWRALRVEANYRLRFRDNTDIEHHFLAGVRADDLFRGLGAFVSVGADLNNLTTKIHNRVLYNAGVSLVKPWLDARLGILFTDGIGSGLVFSYRNASGTGAAPTDLFPYVLNANRIAYLRIFGVFWKMFAGLDVEENLDAGQLRILAQIGASL